MEEKDVKTIKVYDKETGEERVAKIVGEVFKLEEEGPEYITYHFDEVDDKGLIKLYTSMIKHGEEGISLETVQTEEEWTKIKEVFRQAINENKE